MNNESLEFDVNQENVDLGFLCDSVTALLKVKDQSVTNSDCLIENTVSKLEILFLKSKDKCLKENKALYWFKLGQLYNITNKHKKQAIDPLSKAVKLDPSMIEAWNELGESYWHNNETDLAQKCFENALLHERRKLPLRNLSIVMRKMAVENENKLHYINRGIEYAKEAVNLDLQDGLSWGILGNAYLSAYFGVKQDAKYAKLALSAYKQAEKLPFSMINTELHYNKAFASKYSEQYLEALKSLDKSLEIEKSWEPAAKLKLDLLKYLNEVNSHNLNKGKLKPKKLMTMQKEIVHMQTGPLVQKFGDKLVQLKELKVGKNNNVLVVGKVIWNLSQEESFPFTCGLVDATGLIAVVTVYNMTPGRGFIIGDSIIIPDPVQTIIDFSYDNKIYSFTSIRVDNPTHLIVNNKRLPPAYFTAYSLLTKEKDRM